MKKLLSAVLAVIMILPVFSVAAFAQSTTYNVTFADFPYDVAPFRDDFVTDYMGYEYGIDYWYVITHNEDGFIVIDDEKRPVTAGTTTEIKGKPDRITVTAGETLEFSVKVADYVEAQTVRVLAFETGLNVNELADLDPYSSNLTITPGEPYEQFYLPKTSNNTYGIRPTQDITICVSEYHLFNKCFLYDFPSSDFYTANRLFFCGETLDDFEDSSSYKYERWGNTKVIYENETLFFEVRMDLNSEYDLHYDTYQVYYMVDDLGALVGSLSGTEKVYLSRIYRYTDVDEETGKEEQVDIYAVNNVSPYVQIKVTNTVTYTIGMLAQFVSDFDLNNLSDLDLDSVDMSPMLELVVRIAKLIVKLLSSFGLQISLGDILS